MKLSDVKVGVRVADTNNDGEVMRFQTVKEINMLGHVVFHDGTCSYPAYLRKVKPRKSVRFESSVVCFDGQQERGTLLSPAREDLRPFIGIGKKVIVTVKEKK